MDSICVLYHPCNSSGLQQAIVNIDIKMSADLSKYVHFHRLNTKKLFCLLDNMGI